MFTVLWCYLRNNAFKTGRRRLPRRRRPHRPGQPPRRHHRGRHHQAEAAREQRRLQRAQGLRQDQPARLRRAHHRPPDRPHPLAGRQLLHGPHRADQLRRRVEGRRATWPRPCAPRSSTSGPAASGLITGRKAFQRPMAEGVELLNAIQDVYLDESHHHRLTCAMPPCRRTCVADESGPPLRVHLPTTSAERRRRQRGGPRADTASAPAPVELDRVIIRFAGDSGDGMQLTGDRFTSASALFGNDLATLPEFPAEIRAPGRHAGRRVGVPGPHLRPRHHHAGRRAQRAGGHEPGGAAGRARRARAGRHADRQHRHLRRAQPGQGRLRDQPARPTAASTGYTVYEVPMTTPHQGGRRAARREAPRRRPVEELLRPRPGLVDVHPPDRAHARLDRGAFAKTARSRDANRAAFKAGHAFGETAELFDHPYRGQARPTSRPGTYTNINGNTALAWGLVAASQLAGLPLFLGSLPDHAGVGHPPRAVQAQELRRAHAAGRGRDRRHRRRARRGVRRPPRRHHHQRPGHRPQVARRWAWRSASSCRC